MPTCRTYNRIEGDWEDDRPCLGFHPCSTSVSAGLPGLERTGFSNHVHFAGHAKQNRQDGAVLAGRRAGPLPRLVGCEQNAPQVAVGQPVQIAQGEQIRAIAVALPDFVVAPTFL